MRGLRTFKHSVSYFTDHMVEKVGDELRWGGEEKQSHALTVIKYLSPIRKSHLIFEGGGCFWKTLESEHP